MDSELLTCLLKFIEYFPDHLSALSHTLLRFFWTTFVETAVYVSGKRQTDNNTEHVTQKTTPRAQAPAVCEKTFSTYFVPQPVENTTYNAIAYVT